MFSYLTSFLWSSSSDVAPTEPADKVNLTNPSMPKNESTASLITIEEVEIESKSGEVEAIEHELRTLQNNDALIGALDEALVDAALNDVVLEHHEDQQAKQDKLAPLKFPAHRPSSGRVCTQCKNFYPNSLFMTRRRKKRVRHSEHCRKCYAKLFSWNY